MPPPAEDITRVMARIIDGLRPASSDVRGRPLQQFIAGDQIIYLRSEAVTVTVAASITPKYDVTKYGRGIYQWPPYGMAKYGDFQYGDS